MIRNGPLKISKSLKKAGNGPFGKNLFPITDTMISISTSKYTCTIAENIMQVWK